MEPRRRDLETLVRDVEWALANGLEARELVAMLDNVMAQARQGSPEDLFSRLKIAELVVVDSPWRAALLARSVVAQREDGHAWAVLGLAHTLLGHYRAAIKAYRRALLLSPANASVLHNLGHLLDVALDRPRDALPYLREAYQRERGEPELVSSYAHALLRAGREAEACTLLERGLNWSRERAARQVESWLSAVIPGQ